MPMPEQVRCAWDLRTQPPDAATASEPTHATSCSHHCALCNGLAAGLSGQRPLPPPAASGINHIIVVIMENRSFDHMLGWLDDADGRQAGLTYTDRSTFRGDKWDLLRKVATLIGWP